MEQRVMPDLVPDTLDFANLRRAQPIYDAGFNAVLTAQDAAHKLKEKYNKECAEPYDKAADDLFWNVIASFNWRNKSDKDMTNSNTVHNKLRALSIKRRKTFNEKWDEHILVCRNNPVMIEEFKRCNVSPGDAIKITSHIIGLGREQYQVITLDADLLHFFIASDECQNLATAITRWRKK